MENCPNPEHETALALLTNTQEQHSKRFDLLEVRLKDFTNKFDQMDESLIKIKVEQAKQTEQMKQLNQSVTELKSELGTKAPMPTGVTASIIAAVVSGIFMLGANIILRFFGGN